MSDERLDDVERWGAPPTIDPPPGTSWDGEWERCRSWTSGDDPDAPGVPVWGREALEHDGHEECCGHTRFVWVDVDGSEA